MVNFTWQSFVSSTLYVGFETRSWSVPPSGEGSWTGQVFLIQTSTCRPKNHPYEDTSDESLWKPTLNSASSWSSCFALYACLGFLSTPGFRALLPTGLGAASNTISLLYIVWDRALEQRFFTQTKSNTMINFNTPILWLVVIFEGHKVFLLFDAGGGINIWHIIY